MASCCWGCNGLLGRSSRSSSKSMLVVYSMNQKKIDACNDGVFGQQQYRRQILLLAAAASILTTPTREATGMTLSDDLMKITDRVYLDIVECERGSTIASCNADEVSLSGRIVLGLYGNYVPETVRMFKAMCTGEAGSSYEGCSFHKVIKGSYIQTGHQGRDKGDLRPPKNIDRNLETTSAASFSLRHQRPGTVSLCLSENDDENYIKLNPKYRNVEFMITTGPGPAPYLDNGNIVFGSVVQGMDVVGAIANVPTFNPSKRVREFNGIAEIFGDNRAAKARNAWNRPVRPIFISKCGLI